MERNIKMAVDHSYFFRVPLLMSRRVLVFIAALTLLAGTGCGINVPATIQVPLLKKAKPVNSAAASSGLAQSNFFLFVDKIGDARSTKVIATTPDGQETYTNGDITATVSESISTSLVARGFQLSDSAPVILSGEVQQWSASIVGKVPSRISGSAAISIQILDPANKRIYSGIYHGSAWMESSSVTEFELQKVLSDCMDEAITSIINDVKLTTLLRSY